MFCFLVTVTILFKIFFFKLLLYFTKKNKNKKQNNTTLFILCNRGIIVNSYKLPFPSSHFSSQPNKGKHKSFLSSHFSFLLYKQTLNAGALGMHVHYGTVVNNVVVVCIL